VVAATRQRHGPRDGHENDDGEELFDELSRASGLSLTTTTLIKQAWTPESFRKMRHSWKLLADFLRSTDKTATALRADDARVTAANFQAACAKEGRRGIDALLTNTNVLIETFDPKGAKLQMLVSRAIHRKSPKKGRRYRTMWDIRTLLDHIRGRYGDNKTLARASLLKKALTLTMVFSACRLSELARMTVDPKEVTTKRLRVNMKVKTALDIEDSITFYPVDDKAICPHAALSEWLGQSDAHQTLFSHPETHKPMTATAIAAVLRELMTEAGISEEYGPYSIKHAVVTFLFDQGAGETQINEFGRWSIASRVASAYYRVATPRQGWLGYKLAEAAREFAQKCLSAADEQAEQRKRLAAGAGEMASAAPGEARVTQLRTGEQGSISGSDEGTPDGLP
jgi:hypothetical protein